jgi:hypothetical protein
MSLKARRKSKSSTSKAKSNHKTKTALMNFDADDSQDEEADEEMHEKETECLAQLERALSQCARCDDGVRCKIDRTGHHVPLTFQLLHAWALFVSFAEICVSRYSIHAYILLYRLQVNMV